ncbi:hypothetical protein D3C72_1736060 [compost metagenome]
MHLQRATSKRCARTAGWQLEADQAACHTCALAIDQLDLEGLGKGGAHIGGLATTGDAQQIEHLHRLLGVAQRELHLAGNTCRSDNRLIAALDAVSCQHRRDGQALGICRDACSTGATGKVGSSTIGPSQWQREDHYLACDSHALLIHHQDSQGLGEGLVDLSGLGITRHRLQ